MSLYTYETKIFVLFTFSWQFYLINWLIYITSINCKFSEVGCPTESMVQLDKLRRIASTGFQSVRTRGLKFGWLYHTFHWFQLVRLSTSIFKFTSLQYSYVEYTSPLIFIFFPLVCSWLFCDIRIQSMQCFMLDLFYLSRIFIICFVLHLFALLSWY